MEFKEEEKEEKVLLWLTFDGTGRGLRLCDLNLGEARTPGHRMTCAGVGQRRR